MVRDKRLKKETMHDNEPDTQQILKNKQQNRQKNKVVLKSSDCGKNVQLRVEYDELQKPAKQEKKKKKSIVKEREAPISISDDQINQKWSQPFRVIVTRSMDKQCKQEYDLTRKNEINPNKVLIVNLKEELVQGNVALDKIDYIINAQINNKGEQEYLVRWMERPNGLVPIPCWMSDKETEKTVPKAVTEYICNRISFDEIRKLIQLQRGYF